ncbi:MAG: bifunctional UDP-N-acetylglucosamine diphosphorylase/glucosamine-1-phosphate N-acetyltransferase GlmU [Bdellovibrionia bacterium]
MMEKQGRSVGVMILAAGSGKRMKSALPKVLHEIGGKPLLYFVLQAVRQSLPWAKVALIVGYGREQIESYVKNEPEWRGMDIEFILQPKQLGTGHAVACALKSVWAERLAQASASVLVLPGDQPLITADLIEKLVEPLKRGEALRLLTCELENPTGYGRVIRRGKAGSVLRIVEEKDATVKEKQIHEVANSIYFFSLSFLKQTIGKLTNQNAQEEYYLTDLISLASRAKKKIPVLKWQNSEDLRGVNDPWQLAQAQAILNQRTLFYWSQRGVRFLDLASVRIDASVELDDGVVIHPGVILTGQTRIKSHSTLGPYVILHDVEVGSGVFIKAGSVGEKSKIGDHCQVGPYAHLRAENEIGSQVKIGNFVELKKTKLGNSTSVAHLSYLGDAEVGKRVNIGCGFVTCNYDGRVIQGQRKHRTLVEDDAFVGSDCQAVAPVRIGRGAFIASGSTITEDVPADALAIARSKQVNKPGYVEKLKGKKGAGSCVES